MSLSHFVLSGFKYCVPVYIRHEHVVNLKLEKGYTCHRQPNIGNKRVLTLKLIFDGNCQLVMQLFTYAVMHLCVYLMS